MPKRVLSNIANNLNNLTNAGLKRTADNSPSKLSTCKKSRSQKNHSEVDASSLTVGKENAKPPTITNQKKETESSTRTLELRVRNIQINTEESLINSSGDVSFASVESKTPKTPARMSLSPIKKYDFSNPETYYQPPKDIPAHVEDFDRSQLNDTASEPHYAADVFNYYQEKELQYKCKKYLNKQTEISKAMRSVLVDWLVEVQESFELNHETLYLAIKIIDHYLMQEDVPKSRFQLLGATAILIAAKFDERIPPSIDDFLYICDNAYTRRDVILLEIDCAKLSMEVLTLARYVLEMSLMEYDLIEERDSLIAAASLLLALKMKGVNDGKWSSTLEFYSGYSEEELTPITYKLNDVISTQKSNLRTIKAKYSHK
ncbi:G2/mitotic-specific cyclin-B3-like protein [Dinothrombium tinctorium]|uniref:G2/mitotic-specific cyclin-B3-like protein n=1 Tax=Dinothrombium tinctorium TaxID=1965070 RepID=A0A3S3S977_9ACAR|nr:G2/mitotic-specific cyclin-B3-like protein [Dinothrombium tinctorium]